MTAGCQAEQFGTIDVGLTLQSIEAKTQYIHLLIISGIDNESYSEYVHCVKISLQQITKLETRLHPVHVYFGTNYIIIKNMHPM